MLKTGLALALFVLSIVPCGESVASDHYPSRPVRIIVPFAPASTADLAARILSERLASRLKQPVIVDNKAGAGGSIGAAAVAKEAPDGYTLLVTTSSPLVINPSLYKQLGYDPQIDFAPVGMVASLPLVLVASPTIPAKDLRELISFLKNNANKANYASNGQGSYAHITMERFKQVLSVDLDHIPYKGPAAAESDVLAGNVTLMFTGIATSIPLIKAGRLRAYGITSKERSRFAPEIQTFAAGALPELRDFVVTSWISVLAPKGTPVRVINRLNAELNAILQEPGFQEAMAARSFVTYPVNTPKDVTDQIAAELPRWAKVLRDARVDPE